MRCCTCCTRKSWRTKNRYSCRILTRIFLNDLYIHYANTQSAPLQEAEMSLKNFEASKANVRFIEAAHNKAMTALVQGHTLNVKLSAAIIAVSAGYVFMSKASTSRLHTVSAVATMLQPKGCLDSQVEKDPAEVPVRLPLSSTNECLCFTSRTSWLYMGGSPSRCRVRMRFSVFCTLMFYATCSLPAHPSAPPSDGLSKRGKALHGERNAREYRQESRSDLGRPLSR